MPIPPDAVLPKVVIDGVFFQINQQSGIARVWRSLLQVWAQQGKGERFVILDREGSMPRIPGFEYYSLAAYDYQQAPQDSAQIQAICDQVGADCFISTYYTTPLTTPSLFLAHDMIPEVLGMDLSLPCWREKAYSILHASRHLAVSHNTARDLVAHFPHLSLADVLVTPCGLEPRFRPASPEAIADFRQRYNLTGPFVVLVGERIGINHYKNAITFFSALATPGFDFPVGIVCVGGKPELEPELAALVPHLPVQVLALADAELGIAYSAALALIYPSCYEGFGLPILEAMACGCPVIAGCHSSIPEAGGAAVYYLDVLNPQAWCQALTDIQKTEVRQALIQAGFRQSQKFSWVAMADSISHCLLETHQGLKQGQFSAPPQFWPAFRQQQHHLQSLTQQLAQSQARLQQSEQALQQVQTQCQQLQAQCQQAQGELTAIKESRWWQLREAYGQIKTRCLGARSDAGIDVGTGVTIVKKCKPIFYKPSTTMADLQPTKVPQTEDPKFGFNDYAERLNGRAAMIGFLLILVIEYLTGKGVLAWLGLK
ncbi:hypothetical protein OLK001_02040 [Synechocystis sp. LKSZ1]